MYEYCSVKIDHISVQVKWRNDRYEIIVESPDYMKENYSSTHEPGFDEIAYNGPAKTYGKCRMQIVSEFIVSFLRGYRDEKEPFSFNEKITLSGPDDNDRDEWNWLWGVHVNGDADCSFAIESIRFPEEDEVEFFKQLMAKLRMYEPSRLQLKNSYA